MLDVAAHDPRFPSSEVLTDPGDGPLAPADGHSVQLTLPIPGLPISTSQSRTGFEPAVRPIATLCVTRLVPVDPRDRPGYTGEGSCDGNGRATPGGHTRKRDLSEDPRPVQGVAAGATLRDRARRA